MAEKDLNQLNEERNKLIVRTSIIGILANVLLAGFKMVVGLFAHSIAIILDAVNNLSDVLSSLVTIVGNKLANKAPDRKHPLGHGRVEYISALIVSAIILYAGVTAAIEAVKKIINPETPNYTTVTLFIIAVAVVVKIVLGLFVSKQGKKAKSGALEASGKDALFDAVISASVLASAIIYLTTKVSLEAYVAVIISIFIIKAGIEIMAETISEILGKRADADLTKKVKEILNREPEVRGAYDLLLNNYGPNKNYASVHLELPDTMTVDEVDVLTRKLEMNVYKETGIILTGVGVYSYNTSDTEVAHIRNEVQEMVMAHDWSLQMHGFYLDTEKHTMRFDVVMSFDIDPKEGIDIIRKEVGEAYPEYELNIIADVDIAD
ncbi:MAG: cation transporter [Eubacterium sp.]|nr:cation transporter [Eubacterium sp.]MBR3173077.1 cation transporter [Eubacterium sp.]HAR91673.1 cation transporter [Eubacterium sp.]